MAGDAGLGITPVMKWNFERSCYRWLVTRHPAQFERLDFTAQILQSASRARKAFYECGWAEAKVLIRPSDGKFERTPFFDAIIRRGLRNSTRFDAATLTEDEIEALGMHRDETLGFKLQIRHFRSKRKELPPQGRARKPALPPSVNCGRAAPLPGTVARAVSASNPVAASQGCGGGGGGGDGGRDVGGGSGAHAPTLVVEQQPWRTEAAAVARSPGDQRWAEEVRWHRGVNGNCSGGPVSDGGGGGGGERWRAWEANRWVRGTDGPNAAAADERNHHRFNGHTAAPPHALPQHAPASLVPGLAQASSSSAGVGSARRVVWDGPAPGRVWGGLERRPASSWHPSAATVDGRGKAYERLGHKGVSPGDGGGHDGYGGGGGVRREQHIDSDFKAGCSSGGGFGYHQSAIEQQQQYPGSGRSPSGAGGGDVDGPPSGFRIGCVGMDGGPVRGGSPDSSSAGAAGTGGNGSLLSQGYRRLAAMADERAVRGSGGQPDAGRRGGPLAAVLNQARLHSPTRPPLPHHYDGAAENDLKRPAASGVVVVNGSNGMGAVAGGVGHGQFSSRRLQSAPGEEDTPAKKKQRPSFDGGERPVLVNDGSIDGGLTQQQHANAPVKRGRSGSNDRRLQTAWPRDVGGLSRSASAVGNDDLLASEMAESLRKLTAARDALDLAQARYEQASRAHNEVIAAMEDKEQRSMKQQQQQQQQQKQQQVEGENMPEDCGSLHSLARSCEAAAASETDAAAPAGRATSGGGRQDDCGRVCHASAGDAAGAGDRNSDDERDRHVPVVRRSSAAASGRTGNSEVAGRSSSSTRSTSGRKSLSSASEPAAVADDCADEMRAVKLEAALLCGIGRAPARRSSLTIGAAVDEGVDIVSSAAATAPSPSSDKHAKHKPRGDAARHPHSSSPGGIRDGGGGGGGADLSRTSSAPHLSSLSLRRHHSGDGGGAEEDFRRSSSDSHPLDRATRGHGGAGAGGSTLPPMAQMPGSPSANGETDSDHSDSVGGGGGAEAAAESKHRQLHRGSLLGGNHGSGFNREAPDSMERGSWGGYSRRGRHVGGARGYEGLSCA